MLVIWHVTEGDRESFKIEYMDWMIKREARVFAA